MDPRRLAETVRRHRALRRWARVMELVIVVVSAAAVALVIHKSL